MKLFLLSLLVFVAVSLSACGGGGGGSSSTSTSTSPGATATTTSYSAALSVGDSGTLDITSGSSPKYVLKIKNSSYGLTDTTISGDLTASTNGDGNYTVNGSKYGKVFVYPCYSIMPVPMSTSTIPNLYVPLVALKNACLMTTVDQITNSGALNNNFKSVYLGWTSQAANGTKSYQTYAANGAITKISDTQFSVRSCTNGGNSLKNANLGSCSDPSLNITTTFTYTATANNGIGAWVGTQSGQSSTTTILANFVADNVAGTTFGYIDISDSAKKTAGFSIVALSKTSVREGSAGLSGTFSGVSYQLCTDINNCADTDKIYGIFTLNKQPINSSNPVVNDPDISGCRATNTDDSPISGFSANVHTASSISGKNCTSPGNAPDNLGFQFGWNSAGKGSVLQVNSGFDNTYNPAATKMSIIIISVD
jgi:hypothetical protein